MRTTKTNVAFVIQDQGDDYPSIAIRDTVDIAFEGGKWLCTHEGCTGRGESRAGAIVDWIKVRMWIDQPAPGPAEGVGSVTLLRITTPYAIAGVELAGGTVTRAAPIVRYLTGWSLARVQAYCQRKGWGCEVVTS